MGGIIVWQRLDLRTGDNPAIHAAAGTGRPVTPVYIHAPGEEGDWPHGAASRWWLHQSLLSHAESLDRLGSKLILAREATAPALIRIARECGADTLYYSRRHEPALMAQERSVEKALSESGIAFKSFNASLLHEPGDVLTKEGNPYKVFTPYWRACIATGAPEAPLPSPRRLVPPSRWPESVKLNELGLEPALDWAGGMRAAWRPGEHGADEQARRFFDDAALQYETGRDHPAIEGVSRLSPHLHFGEISPRRLWHMAAHWRESSGLRGADKAAAAWTRQLIWREFAHQLLFHYPRTTTDPLKTEFREFPWRPDDGVMLRAWRHGRTGFPIVDAGMRELWATGWMHNRVRMITASFLVKDLRIGWTEGARWFWDTLVDADLANNTLGWQWVAGCGADAAPYFRIFNPTGQGEKFDPDGEYVRRWVPELSGLSNAFIHRPWEAPPLELAAAGIRMGETYPKPVVDHAREREKALMAYETLKRRRDPSPEPHAR